MPEIKFLTHSQIDQNLWDVCVQAAPNNLVYAYSWCLNALCGNEWNAVVIGNYEAVFPLPYRKKWGISYIYQPFFCQQLGLFGQNNGVHIHDVLNAIPSKYRRVHLQLNPAHLPEKNIQFKTNYLLDLNQPYAELKKAYNKDAKQNIKKYAQLPIVFSKTSNPQLVLELHQNVWGEKDAKLRPTDYSRFIDVCEAAKIKSCFFTIEAHLNGELLGAAIFIQSAHRLHYLVSGPTAKGREISIMHGIIDYIIQTFAEQKLILDFEGSEIPEVAKFYKKWGAQPEKYGVFLWNRLLNNKL